MTKKKYELTPEHRAQLEPWRDKWIANAMNTAAMTAEEKEMARAAVLGLYEAAKFPAPKNIVFVPSPLVAAIAGPIAAGVWHMRKDPAFARAILGASTVAATEAATRAATWDATEAATGAATWDATGDATVAATVAATWAATRAATRSATWDATWAATEDATRDATEAATRDATRAATWAATEAATGAATRAATEAATGDATRDATRAATWDATEAATEAATEDATGANAPPNAAVRWLINLVGRWHYGWAWGSFWSSYPAFLSFFDRVVGLNLSIYDKWRHYETLALHSCARYMQPDFCMVVDRPEVLLVDAQNRPHCATGPSHKWRDGWKLYHYHGVRIPAGKEWIIEEPSKITVAGIDAEQNSEIRRVMIEMYGAGRYLVDSGAEEVHRDECGVLLRKTVDGETLLSVRVLNSTPEPDGTMTKQDALKTFVRPMWWNDDWPPTSRFKEYFLDIHPECRPMLDDGSLGEPQKLTARNAVASTFGLTGDKYAPQVET